KGHAHPGIGLTVVGIRYSGVQRPLFECAVALVAKQKLFHPIVGDKDIREAVAIVVVESHAERFAFDGSDSRTYAYVAKFAAPFIVEEHIRHAAELVRTAICMEWRSAKDVPADVPI